MFSNNLLRIFLACIMGFAGNNVYARTSVTMGYSDLSTKVQTLDASLSAITIGLAYEIENTSTYFTLVPQILIGKGVKNDTAEVFGFDVVPAKVSIERYLVMSLRGNFALSYSVYLFAQPVYTNLKVGASNFGENNSDSDWSIGYGIGAGFKPTNNISLEVGYGKFDETDSVTGTFRYRF